MIATVIVVVIVLVWALTGGLHSNSGNSPEILVPAGSFFTLPAGQLNDVSVVVGSTATFNGTISESYGLAVYVMTPTQLASFLKSLKLAGYEWSSGNLTNDTVYTINVSVPPGSWDLVFLNPNTNIYISTSYGFYTALTLIKS